MKKDLSDIKQHEIHNEIMLEHQRKIEKYLHNAKQNYYDSLDMY